MTKHTRTEQKALALKLQSRFQNRHFVESARTSERHIKSDTPRYQEKGAVFTKS